MKKVIVSFLFLAALTGSPVLIQNAQADVCIPADPDFDAGDCASVGGTVGVPSGTGAGPGGAGDVPIDGGLSIMLAIGGAISARKAFKKKSI